MDTRMNEQKGEAALWGIPGKRPQKGLPGAAGKRALTVALAAFAALAALSGCGKKASDEVKTIQESGVFRVALVNTDSAYTSLENGQPVGLEPELAEYIAQALGCQVQYELMDRSEALAALSSGGADAAMGCLNASAGLGADYQLSTPYGKGFFYVVTKRGDFALTIGSLENSKVGVAAGLDEETRARLYGAEGITLTDYSQVKEAGEAVKDGTIRAYICYEAQAKSLLEDRQLQVQNLSNMEPEEFVVAAPGSSRTLVSGMNTLIGQFLEAE